MDALDSPLEALEINYVRFGLFAVVNNLWTWVAVLTAALSFWRIRASAVAAGAAAQASSYPRQPPVQEEASSNGCSQSSVSGQKPCPSRRTDVPRAAADSPLPLAPVSGDYEAMKGRFTVYYEDDSNSDDDEELEEPVAVTGSGGGGGAGDYCSGSDWWSGWEMVLKVRNGDVGWYRCQDPTLLDGSVVRLWDDARLVRRLGH